jgi:agmatine deiminase
MTHYLFPAEWAQHEAVWIGFPSHPELWQEDYEEAQEQVAAFVRTVHAEGAGEQVLLVVANAQAEKEARALVGNAAEIVTQSFGDIWLRDTGAIVVKDTKGERHAMCHKFNFWGSKYDLPGDEDIGARLARAHGLQVIERDWILEGGAIDGNGTDTLLTTQQCLLNPNRNPKLSAQDIAEHLAEDFSATKIVWLGDGLANDHTDGHVDNLARFVSHDTVALPEPTHDDPNAAVFHAAKAAVEAAGLKVALIPSLGGYCDEEGAFIPASYMNFYIGNAVVVVPQYDAPNDAAAVAAIAALFPTRKTIGLAAEAILSGGGSFHCISQQIPA